LLNILPIKESGQLNLIEHPYLKKEYKEEWISISPRIYSTPFSDNSSLKFVSGHTQSMMLPQISYKGNTIVFMADLLPSHGHIPIPYVMAYDMYPLTTLNEKKWFLTEAVENNYTLFFEHDPKYECCNLQQTEKGIRPKDFFKLEEI
jgi:hypothetical protein